MGCASPEASAFLEATPSTPCLTMHPKAFRIAVRRLQGIPLTLMENRRCTCGEILDPLGNHLATICRRGGDRNDVHNAMNLCLRDLVKCSGQQARVEVDSAFRITDPANGSRPDILIRGAYEYNLYTDTQITNPCDSRVNPTNCVIQGRAATVAERAKTAKYGAACRAQGAGFIPCIYESYGSQGPELQKLFKHLISQMSEYQEVPAHVLSKYWMRRFSVTLHREVSNCILRKLGRLNAMPFRDESSISGVMQEQSDSRY